MTQRRGNNRRGENSRQQKKKRYGGPRKANLIEQSRKDIEAFRTKANKRFDYEFMGVQPIGFPDDMEEPKSFSFEWISNPVNLADEERMAT
ncbi:MAG: hypothetical protein HOJ55_05035, partial [Euryarchaeota archaeon]|nr:hypothetical protein [Euryarchaeota archaeon]